MTTKLLYSAVAALALFSSMAASQSKAAVTVKAKFVARDAGSSTSGSSPAGTPNAANAGQFHWTSTPAWNPSGVAFRDADGSFSTTSFISYCIEISELISLNSTPTFNLIQLKDAPQAGSPPFTPTGSLNASRIAGLWANYLPGGTGTGVALNANNVAAFQVAVWALVYGNPPTLSVAPSLTTGNVKVTAVAIRNLAQGWLNAVALKDNDPTYARANVMALSLVGTQDHLVEVVPEPASLVVWSVLGGSAAGLAVARRRRRNATTGRWSVENRSAIFAVVDKCDHH